MLHLKQAIIVEGKYDKIKLQSVTDALILTTDGFRIYKDAEKMSLIRVFAERDGIIILTDSDAAGFQIRNHLKGSIPKGKIYNVYIPDVFGKEKRKVRPSKEGKLGVEGISRGTLEKALLEAGLAADGGVRTEWLDRARLMDDRLIGADNCSGRRELLLKGLGLPARLSVSGMIEILNRLYTEKDYEKILSDIK